MKKTLQYRQAERRSSRYNVAAVRAIMVLSIGVSLLALRLYIHFSYGEQAFMKTYTPAMFSVQEGDAVIDEQAITVEDANADGASRLSLASLSIPTRFYEAMTIHFSQKHLQQPLSLVLRYDASNSQNIPIVYTQNMIAHVDIEEALGDRAFINALDIVTPRLIEPYGIIDLTFTTRPMSMAMLLEMIVYQWSVCPQVRENNTLCLPQGALLSPQRLLLCYFLTVSILLLLYCMLTRRRLTPLVWALMIGCWLSYDLTQLSRSKTDYPYQQNDHSVRTEAGQ